jgi:hypothetical protein
VFCADAINYRNRWRAQAFASSAILGRFQFAQSGANRVKRSLTFFGAALLLLSVTAAFGDSLVMQCNKGNCVRARCDEWGEHCQPAGVYARTKGQYAVPQSKQVCNEFGDCHFALPSLPPTPAAKAVPAAAVTPAPVAVAPVPAALTPVGPAAPSVLPAPAPVAATPPTVPK